MNYTLRYRSSRSEIWAFYWVMWRAMLWKLHVLLACVAGFVFSGAIQGDLNIGLWVTYSAIFFPVVVALFAVVPQLMFKGTERILCIGPQGWSSQIGKKFGARTWGEVAELREECSTIIIRGTNGNALVIPSRAFASEVLRKQILKDACLWHEEHVVQQGVQADVHEKP